MGDGPVGVDLESIAEVARRWQPDLVLAPGESAEDALERARMWAAKEAVLKAYGVGLDQSMTTVRLDDPDGPWWAQVEAPDGYVAVVAGLR